MCVVFLLCVCVCVCVFCFGCVLSELVYVYFMCVWCVYVNICGVSLCVCGVCVLRVCVCV